MRGVTEEQKKQAAAMFAEGASVNKVAETVGIGWITAKNLQGGAPKPNGKPQREVVSTLPEEYELTVRVPVELADKILASFTTQEKMDAIASVLQARVATE